MMIGTLQRANSGSSTLYPYPQGRDNLSRLLFLKFLVKGVKLMIEQQEILFRGKRVYNGKWVEGGYWCNKTATRISFYIIDNDGNSYKVIPETISQFTGRSDKYGEKIFGGDVLKGYQYPFLSDGVFNYYGEVIWFDNCPAFGIYTFKAPGSKVRGASTGNTSYMEDWQPELWEIVGNVHDNPKLMGV